MSARSVGEEGKPLASIKSSIKGTLEASLPTESQTNDKVEYHFQNFEIASTRSVPEHGIRGCHH